MNMDKDKVKGAVDDAAGRVKRQVGEWTGNNQAQVEGAAQQVKGKAEKALGNVKDIVKDAKTDADREHERNVQAEKDRDRAHVGSGGSHRS